MMHSLTRKAHVRPQLSELVINWHITEACNYRCRYCYAQWDGSGRELIHHTPATTRMLKNLWRYFHPKRLANPLRHYMDWQGVRLNLAGGEPLLYPEHVHQILALARGIGFTTSLITNGSHLSPELTQQLAPNLSILGISLDSAIATINHQIGRQSRCGQLLTIGKLEVVLAEARRCNPSLQIKLNTVVNALNHLEDFSALIQRLAPQRWKVLRMLPVVTNELAVSDSDFHGFVNRHQDLGDILCVEDNTEMADSYVMVDPLGRFFQSSSGQSGYRYSRPILEVGVGRAFATVGMDPAKFCARYLASFDEVTA